MEINDVGRSGLDLHQNEGGLFQTSLREDDSSDSEIDVSLIKRAQQPESLFNLEDLSTSTSIKKSDNMVVSEDSYLVQETSQRGVDIQVGDDHQDYSAPRNPGVAYMKKSKALELMDSFGIEEVNDISWLKDESTYGKKYSRTEEDIIVYQDSQDFSNVKNPSIVSATSLVSSTTKFTEKPTLDDREIKKRLALNDITAVFDDEFSIPKSEHIENSDPTHLIESSTNDAGGQYEKAIIFGDIFNKEKFLLGRIIPYLKRSDSRGIENPLQAETENTYSTPLKEKPIGFWRFKDMKNLILNSNSWISIKFAGENKENVLKPASSNMTLNSIWKSWRRTYYWKGETDSVEGPDANHCSLPTEESLLESPNLAQNLANTKVHKERIGLRQKGKELTRSSTRSMENLRTRFDTLKLDLRYKKFMRREVEEQHYKSTESNQSPLKEIEFFFDRSNRYPTNDKISIKSPAKTFGIENELGKLKVVDNKLKLSKNSSKQKLEMTDDDLLDSICRDENIQKVEVLKRLENGSIKTRGSFRV